MYSYILRKRELIENYICFYGLNGFYYIVIICICRDKGKFFFSRVSVILIFFFSDGIFVLFCRGVYSVVMVFINMIKFFFCVFFIIFLIRYFSMFRVVI